MAMAAGALPLRIKNSFLPHSFINTSYVGIRIPVWKRRKLELAPTGVSIRVVNGSLVDYPPPRFSVAPMMDWTDNHFRSLARIMSHSSWLYTEMIVAETIMHHENLDRLLEFPVSQHPIVLQLGGSNPNSLAKAAELASSYGYDEINFNCGCPSSKVAGKGCFGARLMLSPMIVGEAMQAIASSCNVPVTVKCRIGVDDADSYEQLCDFVSVVSSMSPTEHFIIHARKAFLDGLNPAKNRTVPPLRYEYVLALMRDFPHLQFTINGGILNLQQVNDALGKGVHGVMVGRAAYNSPWIILANVDTSVYGKPRRSLTRREVLMEYEKYAETAAEKYGPNRPSIRQIVKPLLHLFHAEQGAGLWRRAVDESLRHAKSVEELLKETLPVLPDSVLDAPVPESSGEGLFQNLGLLPPKPALGGVRYKYAGNADDKKKPDLILAATS